jgi:ATP phosphoribosyltransferase
MRIGLACEAGAPPAGVLDLLEAAGLPAASVRGRAAPALVAGGSVTWLLGSPGDVLRALGRGALDAGVIGSDRLLEDRLGAADLLDLRCARDDLVVAFTPAGGRPDRRPRIATRHPQTARRHFAAAGAQPEILVADEPLLAISLGLADGVAELRSRLAAFPDAPVLVEREVVAACSAHLVAARAARVLLRDEIKALVDRLRAALEQT